MSTFYVTCVDEPGFRGFESPIHDDNVDDNMDVIDNIDNNDELINNAENFQQYQQNALDMQRHEQNQLEMVRIYLSVVQLQNCILYLMLDERTIGNETKSSNLA